MFDQEFFDFSLLVAFLAVFFIGNAHCCPEHDQLRQSMAGQKQEMHDNQQGSGSQQVQFKVSTSNELADLATAVLY